MHRAFRSVAVALLLLTAAPRARADSLPLQDCEGMNDGDPCMNAGATADQNGVCTSTTCSSPNYNCDPGVSSPCGTVSTPCMVCLAGMGDGGADASRTDAGSGSGSDTLAFGSGSGSGKIPKLAACAAEPVGLGTAGGAFAFVLAGILVVLARRRPS